MLLARYAPVGSQRYEKLAQSIKSFDKIMEWIPAQLFGIWTVFVAGIAAGKATADRFYFWDWSDWLIGTLGLIAIMIVFYLLSKKFKSFAYKDEDISLKTRGYNVFMALVVFQIAFIIFGNYSIFNAVLYVLPYFAIYLIHTIKIDKNHNSISNESNKHVKTLTATILVIIAAIIGYIIDDPVLSTASIVTLPFLLILLFGKHVRHLERAKFYPIFIFAMFVVSREAWFSIPIVLLFFVLRGYNYLRYQKVYPTFGVTDDQS